MTHPRPASPLRTRSIGLARSCARRGAALLACMAFHATASAGHLLVVDTTAPPPAGRDGKCSLQEAVAVANAGVPHADCPSMGTVTPHTITFDPLVFPFREDRIIALDAPLSITAPMVIEGPGRDLELRRATGRGRVIEIGAVPGPVHVLDLTLRDGSSVDDGGLLHAAGPQLLRLDGVALRNGQAARGGAMALELDGDTTLELIGVTMQGNTADLHGGGLAVFGEGTLTLSASENSSWIGNVAGDNGGALSLVPTACTGCAWTAALERSVFTDNQAQDGGAVYWSNLGTQLQGSLRIEHSLLRGNSAANGGAICVDTPTPNNGAAVHLQLLESVLRDNDADNGGAAYLSRVDATIGNSVFESNASNRGGALFANLLGGSPFQFQLFGSTFRGNTAADYGATLMVAHTGAVDAYMAGNAIVRGGLVSRAECSFTDATLLQGGYNASNHSTCAAMATDLHLPELPLVDRGVPGVAGSPIPVPPHGSLLIDAWPAAACVDAAGTPIEDMVAGARRSGGAYPDGDANGTGDCDIGSFERAEAHAVVVQVQGSGTVTSTPAGIDCPGTCQDAFEEGQPIELVAQASEGSTFLEWTGACAGQSAQCALTPAGPVDTTAVFESVPTQPLTLQVSGNGRVTSQPAGVDCAGGSCSSHFPAGSSVTLTATAGANAVFVGYTGDCSGSSCTLSMDAARQVQAQFQAVTHRLTVVTGGITRGIVTSTPAGIDCGTTCQADFANGATVQLVATALPGWDFTGWSGTGCATNVCSVEMIGDRTAAAVFTASETLFADGFE